MFGRGSWKFLLVVLAVLATGCGGGGDDGDAEGTTTSSTPSTTSTTEPEEEPEEEADATDLLSFSNGAIPFSVAGPATEAGLNFEEAVKAIDGDSNGFALTEQGLEADAVTELVYELPALTTFERFAVPNIQETPSPGETFTREIEVLGSADGPEGTFETLASATLEVHDEEGQETELEIESTTPVNAVTVRLVGGIEEGATFFEFSEIIGTGSQEEVELVDSFTGIWDADFGLIELKQDGVTISGCADDGTKTVTGVVTGNLARGELVDTGSGTEGAFIVSVSTDGELRGVRSDNGGPFAFYSGPLAPDGTTTPCSDEPEPENPLACGSTVYGINFDVNSAEIRPESDAVLEELFTGLEADDAASITIEGHTSSEGSDELNQDLSERRAQAVVDDLVGRGIDEGRISAAGKGESELLISPDVDEAARATNRRVEIVCA